MKRIGIFLGLTALGMFGGYTLLSLYFATMTILPVALVYGMIPPSVSGMMCLGGFIGALFGVYYAGVRFYLKG